MVVDTGGQAHSMQAGSHSPECEWHLARHLSLSLFSVERNRGTDRASYLDDAVDDHNELIVGGGHRRLAHLVQFGEREREKEAPPLVCTSMK